MKNPAFSFLLILAIAISSCKQKDKTPAPSFISITSLINDQVKQIDTSLYSIVKVVTYDSLHIDTSFVPREKFAEEAKDFLSLPDLSEKKVARRFKEEPARYDNTINRAILTYLPVEPDKEPIKKIELLVTPVLGEESKINNIIIDWNIRTKDSALQKRMLWIMNKSFQVVSISQKPGKPEIITFTKVTWNEGPQ